MINLTPELAEFVGIMLGDGCAQQTTSQITISGGTIDGSYITDYIPLLIEKLFLRKVGYRKTSREGFDCIFSSKKVCEMLKKEMDFISPKTNCKIPTIFFRDNHLLKSCIRGLFDTDGGIHRHHKKSAQLKFTNKSHALVWSLYKALKRLNYWPSITVDHKEKNTLAIYLFNKDVKKYFKEIGSNNPKNKIKFQEWIETGTIPLNKEICDKVRLSKKTQEHLLNKKLDSIKYFGFGEES